MCAGLQGAGGRLGEGLRQPLWLRGSGRQLRGCGEVPEGWYMHLAALRSRLPPPCLSGTETLLSSQGRGQEDLQCRPEPVSVWSPRGPQL